MNSNRMMCLALLLSIFCAAFAMEQEEFSHHETEQFELSTKELSLSREEDTIQQETQKKERFNVSGVELSKYNVFNKSRKSKIKHPKRRYFYVIASPNKVNLLHLFHGASNYKWYASVAKINVLDDMNNEITLNNMFRLAITFNQKKYKTSFVLNKLYEWFGTCYDPRDLSASTFTKLLKILANNPEIDEDDLPNTNLTACYFSDNSEDEEDNNENAVDSEIMARLEILFEKLTMKS